jgi:hypothetical protein
MMMLFICGQMALLKPSMLNNEMFGFERLLDVFANTPDKTQVFDEILRQCPRFCRH